MIRNRFIRPINVIPLIDPVNFTGTYALQRRSMACVREKTLPLQLAKDIQNVYAMRRAEKLMPSLTSTDLSSITDQILEGNYSLSPLEFLSSPIEYKDDFLKNIITDYPDYYISQNESIVVVFKASNVKDSIVLMGLSVTLQRLIYDSIPLGFRLVDRLPAFLNAMKNTFPVRRLFKVDVFSSFSLISKELVLKVVRTFVGDDEYLFRLLITLLYLPIYSKYGVFVKTNSAIPPIGEVSRLLFDMVLVEKFDRPFCMDYPGVTFNRFLDKIFITEFDEKDAGFLLEERDIQSYLKAVGLRGKIQALSRGKGFLVCGDGLGLPPEMVSVVILNKDGTLTVNKTSDGYEPIKETEK